MNLKSTQHNTVPRKRKVEQWGRGGMMTKTHTSGRFARTAASKGFTAEGVLL